jgi:hypothetical protein
MIHVNDSFAHALNILESMGDQDDRFAGCLMRGKSIEALFLKCRITYGKNFIDQINIWIGMRGNRKPQSNVHP